MTNVPCVDEPNLFDEPGMANTLRVTLLAMLASALAISALTLLLRWRHTPQLALMSAASCLVALVLSRSGRTKSAILLSLLTMTYAILHLAARSDGIQNIGLAILPVLVMLGSLVLDRLTLVFFAAAEILATVAMLAIRYFVLQAERFSTNDMGDLFIFALTCATAALIGRLLTVHIKDGFRMVRDSESRYRRIFENVHDVYFEMNIDGILLELNPASTALFGMPREEMIGRPLAPFCEFRSEFDVLRAAVREHGRVSNRELAIRDSGAALRHVLVNASLQTGPRAGEKRVIGSIRDITERKRAEEAVRESERTFREFLEGVQFVAVVTALNGKITFFNDYALAITGWSKEEVIGRAAKELLDAESLLQVAGQKVVAAPAGRTQPFVEGSILQKNGGRRWMQWSSTVLRDFAGQLAGFASLGEDVTELRTLRAEAAKRESEERFRNMADWAPVMIWVSGPDKLSTFFNKPWLDFTGRTMEQEMGQGWASGVHPHDLDRCLATYFSSFDARRKFQMEYRLRRADGEYRWLLDHGTPLYRDAEFAGFTGSCIDITERKQAEEALRESEQRVVSIYNTVGDVIFQLAVEPEGRFRFVSVNAAFLRVTGLSLEAVAGKTVNEVIPEASLTTVLGKYQQAVEENTIVSWEETSDYPTGRLTGEVRVAPVFDNKGTCTHLVGSVHDITERRRAEAALRESEERFRIMADTAPVMIWVSGPDKLCTFFNRGWLTFTGSTMDQAVGNGWIEKLHPEDRDRCYTSYASAFDAHRTFQIECRLRRADGEYRWMLAAGAPRFESSGAFVGYVGSCTDITDVKQAQEEALARQKLESLGVLAGGIAHDFNNLLGSIVANSELVLSELPAGSPTSEWVESIRSVAGRAAEIVSQMMMYAGREDTVFEPVDLSGLLHEMLEFLKVSISKLATLNVTLPEKFPTVRANAAQLRQVILNLITNASEALGEQEGVISVAVMQVQSGPSDSASNLSRGDYVRLEVSDTGCGMTGEIQSKIFDPFFTTKFPGRGMGLAAVKGIVRSHGGAINVVSVPGRGSRFEILLPCSSESAREAHDKAVSYTAGEVARFGGTVLFVEDEDPLRIAVSKMLRRRGFTVIEAADGNAGVDLFRASTPEIDVVLLDLTLPGLSGREVLSELRRIQHNVKVIVTSAYSQEQSQTTLGGQQPWFYIRKPYQINELTRLLGTSISDKWRGSDHAIG